jgi:hypothetical protein
MEPNPTMSKKTLNDAERKRLSKDARAQQEKTASIENGSLCFYTSLINHFKNLHAAPCSWVLPARFSIRVIQTPVFGSGKIIIFLGLWENGRLPQPGRLYRVGGFLVGMFVLYF